MILTKPKNPCKIPLVDLPYCIAKTTPDQLPGMTTPDHCLFVGFIAKAIWQRLPEKIQHLIPPFVIPLAAVHDIGKISPGFLIKIYQAIKSDHPKSVPLELDCLLEQKDGFETNHAFIGQAALGEITSKAWAKVVGMHHGTTAVSDCPDPPNSGILGGPEWQALRVKVIKELVEVFGSLPPKDTTPPTDEQLNVAAGLIVFADWIGSDESFLDNGHIPDKNDLDRLANEILDEIDWKVSDPVNEFNFVKSFQLGEMTKPNKIQQTIATHANRPGVYILEAPMGCGKTEASLWAAWKLIKEKFHNGFYFALPTRTTSDRIHERIKSFLGNSFQSTGNARLLHSTAWMHVSEYTPNEDSMGPGHYWFAPAKRGLLCSFGVGTIDQALLGVTNVKHCFLRFFGLASKVVILDEVHSYDIYTGSLLDRLVKELTAAGTSIIILSATLTRERRNELLEISNGIPTTETEPYPLLTIRYEGEQIVRSIPVDLQLPDRRIFLEHREFDLDQLAQAVVDRATLGEMVLCIMNTVDKARELYKRIKSTSTEAIQPERIGLLHSRFPVWKREKLEEYWLNLYGKDGDRSSGAILVATQVVEQSVDIDADIIYTMLAPSDMLLQRIGRLWRHERSDRKADKPCVVILYPPQSEGQSFKDSLETDATIYDPYVLWRSMNEWKDIDYIDLPSGIRPLLESTYSLKEETDEAAVLFKESEESKKTLRNEADIVSDKTRHEKPNNITRYSDSAPLNILLMTKTIITSPKGDVITLADDKQITLYSWTKTKENAISLHLNVVSLRKRRSDENFIKSAIKKIPCSLQQYFFNSDTIVPLVIDSETGNLRTVTNEETPLYYTAEFGVYRLEKQSSQSDIDVNQFNTEEIKNNDEYEDFEW